jgi:hypothetical protein
MTLAEIEAMGEAEVVEAELRISHFLTLREIQGVPASLKSEIGLKAFQSTRRRGTQGSAGQREGEGDLPEIDEWRQKCCSRNLSAAATVLRRGSADR